MGQGGRILLVNKTPYRWSKTYEHSYQMNSWKGKGVFPDMIDPGTSASAYVEFDELVGKIMDDGGEVRYRLDGAAGTREIEVRVHADRSNNYHTYVKCTGFNTNVSKSGQEVELGWWHNGSEVFVLGWDAKNSRFYALASRQSAPDWMSFLDGNKKLTDLTIPGTHDTCAYTVPLNVGAACQTMDVAGQLHAGIRYLDMRLKRGSDNDGVLWLYHASVALDLRFMDVLEDCYKFLDKNDRETILMSVKQEDGGGPAIYDWLKPMIDGRLDKWHLTSNRVPTLDEVRGKIVLFRRFGSHDIGLDTQTGWPDNDFKSFENQGVKFRVQDKYKIFDLVNMGTKWGDCVHSMLNDAKKPENRDRFFINFASGAGALTPRTLATGHLTAKEGTNASIHRYMEGSLSGRYGIIPMDYPEHPNQSLIPLLISQNF